MKIEIEYHKSPSSGGGTNPPLGWTVSQGDRYAEGLSWDEMLGTVASITIPGHKPCSNWLRTREEHKSYYDSMLKAAGQNSDPVVNA